MSDKEIIVSDKEIIVSDEEIIWKWSYSIALILLTIVIFGIFNGINFGLKVNKWSTAQGTVISSEFKECTHGRSKATFFIGTDGLLISKISYRYLINNVTYTGNKIKNIDGSCKGNFFNEDAEKELIEKYSINEKILVYFNSKQPNDSFIFTQDSIGIFDYIGFIFLYSFLSYMIFIIVEDDIKIIIKKDKKELMFFLTKNILNILLIGWKNIKEFVSKHINRLQF